MVYFMRQSASTLPDQHHFNGLKARADINCSNWSSSRSVQQCTQEIEGARKKEVISQINNGLVQVRRHPFRRCPFRWGPIRHSLMIRCPSRQQSLKRVFLLYHACCRYITTVMMMMMTMHDAWRLYVCFAWEWGTTVNLTLSSSLTHTQQRSLNVA